MEIVDVQDYNSALTIFVKVDNELRIPFVVSIGEGNDISVCIDWAAPGLPDVALSPAGRFREAAKKAAEHLEIDADERLANMATALRVYGENYTTNKGRQERLQQIG